MKRTRAALDRGEQQSFWTPSSVARIAAGRRTEQVRERNARYYQTHEQPRYRAFGRVDYTDTEGRQYQTAPRTSADDGDGSVKLWVRLPPGVPWLDLTGVVPMPRLRLVRATDGSASAPTLFDGSGNVRVTAGAVDLQRRQRTGYIIVCGV